MVVLVVTILLAPWSFRIGGRWTPASWWGFGTLRTTAGDEYPLYIYFTPDFGSMTHLRQNGQRPVSGLQGTGWLCSEQGVIQRLDLSGDIYGSRLNSDGDQMDFRLLDRRRYFRINPQNRRYFDLYGSWHGSELVMQDDGGWERGFRLGPHDPKARASIIFASGSYADFKRLCNTALIPAKSRIPPPSN